VRDYQAALTAFLRDNKGGWTALSFFHDGSASRLMQQLDTMVASGNHILPAAGDLFKALTLTPLDRVKVVILGQDPYPTPGDAHGLAFSVNHGVKIPRSLANIFKELERDLGLPRPPHGHLAQWATQGVLLLNTCLTVEAGNAGSHRKLGWQCLTDQIIDTVSREADDAVFILWGADAQAKREVIAKSNHLIIESAHPSPLSARRGFFGSSPFSRANAYLRSKGLGAIDWSLSG
jgi:uracil-DNA glycosylase